MDEDDRDSNGFSENDQDEVMEDVDEPENDHEPEEYDEEGEEEEEAEAEAEAEVEADADLPTSTQAGRDLTASDSAADPGLDPRAPNPAHDKGPNGHVAESAAAEGMAVDSAETMASTSGAAASAATTTIASPQAAGSTPLPMPRLRPRACPEAITARTYDIVPTMAAPQATSINALAVTPDLRFWMTGGSDGYIRKYDGPGTINGRQLLTVAQRHPFVDSVVKAGILMSYWENEEPPAAAARGGEDHILSPVYSLAVHSRALWLLSGTEGGGINLQSVRHDEGKRITCLHRHANAVSVLQLAPDETSVLSGSWDKNIFDWDLNSGHIRRQYDGSGGQISAIELRPASGAPIPAYGADDELARGGDSTMTSSNDKPLPNGVSVNGSGGGTGTGAPGGDASTSGASATINGDDPIPDHESLFGSPGGSLFGGSDAIGGNPFGDDELGASVDMTAGSSAIGGDVGGFSQDVSMGLVGDGTNADDFGSSFSAPADTTANATAAATSTAAAEPGEHPGAGVLPAAGSEAAATGSADDAVSRDAPAPASVYATEAATAVTAPLSSPERQLLQQGGQREDEAVQRSEASQAHPPPSATTQDADASADPATSSQTLQNQTAAVPPPPALVYSSQPGPAEFDPTQVSETSFFSASIDGTIRVWDRRQSLPVARIGNRPGVPPWCMGACWSPDGNRIYAGRRNGIVEEFDIRKARAGWQPERALRFPAGSGPVSAVRAMVNGRHLVCASHDILRLYDLQDTTVPKHSSVPFLIIPGPPRAGVISHLYVDQTSRYMISTAGTRGWEGTNTEVLIGYDIHSVAG